MKNLKNIFLTFIFISAIFITCIDKISGNNISNDLKGVSEKDRYLAEEREHIQKSTGFGYDDCFFFTNAKDSYYNKDFNMEADDHFYKYNVVTKEKTKIFEKHVVTYYPYEEYLYCVLEDNSIIHILQTGEDETFIFKGDGNITDLYVDGYDDIRVLYFMMNNTFYRYFVNEKILDKLFYHKNIHYINPISNYKIEWSLLDPLWTKYVEETGDLENYGGRRSTFLINYDVLNNKHVFNEEQQNPYPPYNIDYLGLDLDNSKNNASEEEISKYVESSIMEEIISKLIDSSIFVAKIYRGCNEIIIDRNANEFIYKNNKRYSKANEKYQEVDWKNAFYATFSKELADVYHQSDMIINIDGITYVLDTGTEINELLDKYSYKILSKENGKIIVELCIPYNDGTEIKNKYTKTEISKVNGKWLITYQDLNNLSLKHLDYENISKYNPDTSDSIILLQTIPVFMSVCLILLIKKRSDTISQKR